MSEDTVTGLIGVDNVLTLSNLTWLIQVLFGFRVGATLVAAAADYR